MVTGPRQDGATQLQGVGDSRLWHHVMDLADRRLADGGRCLSEGGDSCARRRASGDLVRRLGGGICRGLSGGKGRRL